MSYFAGFNDVDSTAYPALVYAFTSSVSTVTTSSPTYSQVPGMSLTPSDPGVYAVMFSCHANTTGNNGSGEVAIFKNGVILDYTNRELAVAASGLSLSSITVASSQTGLAVVSMNGTDTVDLRFRENDNDTFQINERILYLIKLANL